MIHMNSGRHLTYDELIKNLADHADLGVDRQAHLQSCPQCRSQAETLDRRYRRLGQMARELAPNPKRAFRLPEVTSVPRRRQFRPAMAVGLVTVLIMVFSVFWPRVFGPGQHSPQMAVLSADEDKQLMARVDDLVKDAMPKAYQQLLAISEPVLTEELIDWIVPSIEEDQGVKPQAGSIKNTGGIAG